MGKWILCTQPNYAHSKPTNTPIQNPLCIYDMSLALGNGLRYNHLDIDSFGLRKNQPQTRFEPQLG